MAKAVYISFGKRNGFEIFDDSAIIEHGLSAELVTELLEIDTYEINLPPSIILHRWRRVYLNDGKWYDYLGIYKFSKDNRNRKGYHAVGVFLPAHKKHTASNQHIEDGWKDLRNCRIAEVAAKYIPKESLPEEQKISDTGKKTEFKFSVGSGHNKLLNWHNEKYFVVLPEEKEQCRNTVVRITKTVKEKGIFDVFAAREKLTTGTAYRLISLDELEAIPSELLPGQEVVEEQTTEPRTAVDSPTGKDESTQQEEHEGDDKQSETNPYSATKPKEEPKQQENKRNLISAFLGWASRLGRKFKRRLSSKKDANSPKAKKTNKWVKVFTLILLCLIFVALVVLEFGKPLSALPVDKEPTDEFDDYLEEAVKKDLAKITLSAEDEKRYQNALEFLKDAKRDIDAGPVGTYKALFSRENMQTQLQELGEIKQPTKEVTKLQQVLFLFNETYHSNGLKKEEYDRIEHPVTVTKNEAGEIVPTEDLLDVAKYRNTNVANIKKFNPENTDEDKDDMDIYLGRNNTATLIFYIKKPKK